MQNQVIKVNGVVWNVLNPVTYIVERFGLTGRLVWKGKNHGVLLTRHALNGRIRSEKFVAA